MSELTIRAFENLGPLIILRSIFTDRAQFDQLTITSLGDQGGRMQVPFFLSHTYMLNYIKKNSEMLFQTLQQIYFRLIDMLLISVWQLLTNLKTR